MSTNEPTPTESDAAPGGSIVKNRLNYKLLQDQIELGQVAIDGLPISLENSVTKDFGALAGRLEGDLISKTPPAPTADL